MVKLGFTLTVDGLPKEVFVVVEYQGKESVSDCLSGTLSPCYGFRYDIKLASRESGITAQQVVDRQAQLMMTHNGKPVQFVHGIVRQFSQGDIGHHHTRYSLVLVPTLERLSLRQNSRIFQQKTVEDILNQILQEMGIANVSFALTRTLTPREFCVQYRETDLAFVHRLLAEEGITYYIEQSDGQHTIVFCDDSALITKHSEAVPHNALPSGESDEAFVSAFQIRHQSEPSHLVFKDYSFKKPSYGFMQQQQGGDLSFQENGYEHYDFPGRYKEDGSGKAFSQFRLEYLRRESHLGRGDSNHPALQAGVKFDLSDNLEASANRDWLVIEVEHKGTQPQALEEEGGQGATTYHNTFTVLPANKTWRAKPQPKPQVDGPMIAQVVGPAGEEIYCDEHGRVKVHFPWDRESEQNERSSCWVRVSQGWAGTQYGFMAIPRIGHEVIVDFLNGDPDQPIIVGRTYHATNPSPYSLPDNKTRTVLKTKTHKGEGFNELRFEDQADGEEIFIHAQKDQNNVVNNDETTKVGHDRSEDIGNNETIAIGNDRVETVGNNEAITIGVDRSETVGNNETIVVVNNRQERVGANEAIEIGGNQIVTIGGAQAETVVLAKAETIGAAKALSIGAGYQVSVGGAKNESVGVSSTEQVGLLKHMIIGKRFELSVGASSLILNADGTIILQGKDVKVAGAKHVEVNGKLVEVN